jgi:hypothetical protein
MEINDLGAGKNVTLCSAPGTPSLFWCPSNVIDQKCSSVGGGRVGAARRHERGERIDQFCSLTMSPVGSTTVPPSPIAFKGM